MDKQKHLDNDIEEENLYENVSEPEITKPFNPKDVDIVALTMVIANIIDRLEHDEFVLDPDFQRNYNLWDERRQSRLIESLIIKIPLPSFYFDEGEDDKYAVVDGLQRLWAIKRFAALKPGDPHKLRLRELEYLKEYEGKSYEELPLNIQRRIREQTITAFIIRSGTPEAVRRNIFTRINTGGLQLTSAEIRNSIYRGKAALLLRDLAQSEFFKMATRNKVSPTRMQDREWVNRFLAFYLLGTEEYHDNLEDHLSKVLSHLQTAQEERLEDCRKAFAQSMKLAWDLFGENAFRKLRTYMGREGYGMLNKPLFECVSVSLAKLDLEQQKSLLERKDVFLMKYRYLLREASFIQTITNGTARLINIEKRNSEMARIIKETLEL